VFHLCTYFVTFDMGSKAEAELLAGSEHGVAVPFYDCTIDDGGGGWDLVEGFADILELEGCF